MTNRPQVLRSSTPGQVPAAGQRAPGELWTTFPDKQLGIIDTTKTAQPLIAVRFFSTLANYAVGDFVIQAGALYAAKGAITAGVFNATQWTKVAAATDAGGPYLPIAGGTLTGALTLNADPGAALGAATKQYVDGKVTAAPFLPIAGGTLTGKLTLAGPPTNPLDAVTKAYADSGAFIPVSGAANTGLNDNRIINGDMRIDQRNGGAVASAAGYTVDRWQYSQTQTGHFSWGRNIGSVAPPLGFPYYLGFAASVSYTLLANDNFSVGQWVEADAVSDFAWGTANAQSVTLSFWAYSNATGTFSGSIRNAALTRSYPFTFSMPAATTWTKIMLTIPGDAVGTWVLSGNAAALLVGFDLGTGTTARGPAGAWASSNYAGVTGAVSVVATAQYFFLTGVKLETGSVATPFNRQSLAKSMADCQRYAMPFAYGHDFNASSASQIDRITYTISTMRATPTIGTLTNTSTGNSASIAVYPVTPSSVQLEVHGATAGNVGATGSTILSAEL